MNNALSEEEIKKKLTLKPIEDDISSDDPWAHDVLERKNIASAFTNLVSEETNPLVIGLNGHWGTGKTFVLMRWQKELEAAGYQSIYFNAWEDDFCDDPLVAIVGQLENSLKGNRSKKIKDISAKIKNAALPLITENILSILTKQIGVTISSEILENLANQILEKYSAQNQSKIELKKQLVSMAEKVKDETNHPFIFIIDELDRCRPTFAIELLERVKHIFAIPNMIFVFGVNKSELCAAVKSIYGEIDADVYIRRFFDMEFILPEPNSEDFCKHFIAQCKLDKFYLGMRGGTRNTSFENYFEHVNDFFPLLCKHLNLSLRDIQHCTRSLVFVSKSAKNTYLRFPFIVGIFIILRLKNNVLYKEFVTGKCLASKIINYIYEHFHNEKLDDPKFYFLNLIEGQLYCMDERDSDTHQLPALQQLKLISKPKELTHPEYLSDRTKNRRDKERISKILGFVEHGLSRDYFPISRTNFHYIFDLIEISSFSK